MNADTENPPTELPQETQDGLIRGTCPICNFAIKPAKTQAQFNRSLGVHVSVAHGKKALAELRGKDTSKIERDREYARKRRERLKKQQNSVKDVSANVSQMPQPVPLALPQCPHCGTRFWMTKEK